MAAKIAPTLSKSAKCKEQQFCLDVKDRRTETHRKCRLSVAGAAAAAAAVAQITQTPDSRE